MADLDRDMGKEMSEPEIREEVARAREKVARSQGRAPEGVEREVPREASERERNVQSADPEMREEADATRRK
jgi:hypothetical protein